MTREERIKEIAKASPDFGKRVGYKMCVVDELHDIKDLQKENAELEKEISILLSCKNCPENKGGLLCQKEYEDKCLSQKIQYIKELKEENEELKEQLEIEQNARGDWFGKAVTKDRRLTEAKALLTKWVELFKPKGSNIPPTPIQVDTEQFLKEVK